MIDAVVRVLVWLLLLLVVLGALSLCAGCHSTAGRALVGDPPAAAPVPATHPPVVDLFAQLRTARAEVARLQQLTDDARADAHRAITDTQARWATWAAGLTTLGGLVWVVIALWWHLPVRWGAIGAGLGVALLIGARAWAWLGAQAWWISSLALAGGFAMLLLWVVSKRLQHRLPRWLSRILH